MCQSLTCSVLSSRRTTDPTNEYVLRQPPTSTDSAAGGAFRSIKQDCDFGLRLSGGAPLFHDHRNGPRRKDSTNPTQTTTATRRIADLALFACWSSLPSPDHRNFRSLKERSQHQLNWLRLQPAFQINPGHLAQFFDGPRTNALICKVRESCHRLHIAEDYDGHVLRFGGVSPGLRSVNVRTICL